MDFEERTACEASIEMLKKAEEGEHSTAFSRTETMKECTIGASGICCKTCNMGPCRLTPLFSFGLSSPEASSYHFTLPDAASSATTQVPS